ncbi:MAG TPA: hypothetical protein IGS53_00245 [Leptolyngbyaceae cyanobacterium M33_DOE_097]|nr:hypothetical protein [Leptolyngbyaceae cyanobacterium M33_DOE_097]
MLLINITINGAIITLDGRTAVRPYDGEISDRVEAMIFFRSLSKPLRP